MDSPKGYQSSSAVEQTRTNRLRHFLTSGKLVICPWRLEAHGGLAIIVVVIVVLLVGL